MGKHSKHATSTISAAITLILAAAAAQAQEAAAPTTLGQVVVTAQKRAEKVSDIPMSVSVLTGEALERQGANNFQDLLAMVPGLSLTTATRGVTRITLRGANTGGVASTVGVYVNDVPFGSSSGLANGAILSGDFDTFDLARIEVLRGPQGTLYGASSLGGVIKYVSNEPSLAGFEGKLQATLESVEDGDASYSLAGVVNVPMGDKAALRASGFYRTEGGFIDSIGNNPIPSLTDPLNNVFDGTLVKDNFNGVDTYGGRVALLLEPSDNFSLNLSAQMQNIESDGGDAFDADADSQHPLYGGRVASLYHVQPTDIEYRVYSATLNWKTGAGTIESITSYGTFEEQLQTDLTLLPTPPFVVSQLLTFLLGDPATLPLSLMLQQTTSTDKFTQELRFVSPEDQTVEWLVGAYYTDEDSGIDPQTYLPFNASTGEVVSGFPVLGNALITSSYQEFALFANATWHVSPRFELSFGGRYSENDQVASQVLEGLLVGLPTPLVYDDAHSSESPFTYSISPRVQLDDNSSVYARIATGYRPGGPNVIPPGAPPGVPGSYDSDRLTNYEIGLKTGTADGRYTLDVALFYLDWKDIQLFARVNNVGINANGGKAESKGVEFTAAAHPATGWSLYANGAYTDAILLEDTDPLVGGLIGDTLPYVPNWSFGAGAEYEWTVFGDSTAHIGAQIGYTGERTVDFADRTSDGRIRIAKNYTTTDIRAGLDNGRWNFELYCRNLTDEQGTNSISAPGFLPNGAVGIGVIRPRSIGLSVGTRF